MMTENSSFNLQFDSERSNESIKTDLIGDPDTNKLLALFTWRNHTVKPWKAASDDFFLTSTGGGKAHPTNKNLPTIPPGKVGHFWLSFNMINNRLFHKRTGLHGDLKKNYQITFSKQDIVISQYHIPQKSYFKYIETHGKEARTEMYDLDINVAAQAKYQKAIGIGPLLHAEPLEVSLAGANMHMQTYLLNNRLNLVVKILNHSGHDLIINPRSFLLQIDDQLIKPGAVSGPARLKKGEHFAGHYRFPLEHVPESFELHKEFVKIDVDKAEKNLLKSNLVFKRHDFKN